MVIIPPLDSEQAADIIVSALQQLVEDSKRYKGARAVIKKLNDEKVVLNQRIQELADEVTKLRDENERMLQELENITEDARERGEYDDRESLSWQPGTFID